MRDLRRHKSPCNLQVTDDHYANTVTIANSDVCGTESPKKVQVVCPVPRSPLPFNLSLASSYFDEGTKIATLVTASKILFFI